MMNSGVVAGWVRASSRASVERLNLKRTVRSSTSSIVSTKRRRACRSCRARASA